MIIGDFISTDRKLYENVELSVQGILCASVKVSVESVVETVVSRYGTHFSKNRLLNEENAIQEMLIAENGPEIFWADAILDKAMSAYWKTKTENGNWHFQKNSDSI